LPETGDFARVEVVDEYSEGTTPMRTLWILKEYLLSAPFWTFDD